MDHLDRYAEPISGYVVADAQEEEVTVHAIARASDGPLRGREREGTPDAAVAIPAASPFTVPRTKTVTDGGGRITLDGGQRNRIPVPNAWVSLSVRRLHFKRRYVGVAVNAHASEPVAYMGLRRAGSARGGTGCHRPGT
jgi:hypothetical protein